MLDSAKQKLDYAGRLFKLLMGKLNARGLHTEQQQYGLTRQRVVGIRLTDKDIRDAEKKRILPKKIWKFHLASDGQLIRVTDRNREPDVLMHLTFNTFYSLIKRKLSVQEAYRLRYIQVRYMKDVEHQEEDFLKDAGLVLKLMNKIQYEMTRDGGGLA
jgi:hypothetical protein